MTLLRSHSTGHAAIADPVAPLVNNAQNWRAQAWAFLRSHGNKVPPALACPISYGLMLDPVSVSNGQTYDRTSICAWFASPASITENGRFIDPRTRDVLVSAALHPNLTVRAQVAAFKEAVLAIDPGAIGCFELSAAQDTVVTAPRRPSRYMAASWAERHAPQPRYPRGGSPDSARERARPPVEEITAAASRTVDRALADVESQPWPGVEADHLRQHLDDVVAQYNQADQEAAGAEADEELQALREAMGLSDAHSDTPLDSPLDSEEELERELNESPWQV